MGGSSVAGWVTGRGVVTTSHVQGVSYQPSLPLPSASSLLPPSLPSPLPLSPTDPGEGQPVCDVAVLLGHHSSQEGAAPPTGSRLTDQAETEHSAEGGQGRRRNICGRECGGWVRVSGGSVGGGGG